MPDMLVSLIALPPLQSLIDDLDAAGIMIRRADPWEQSGLREFIQKEFSRGWADEAGVAYQHQPITCFVATRNKAIVGFGAYECTRRNFFGPTGVTPSERGKGIGKALFLACLYGLRELGYAYCIIGGAGPVAFYEKAAGATLIPNSVPGIYKHLQ